jgi:hypothetical protein
MVGSCIGRAKGCEDAPDDPDRQVVSPHNAAVIGRCLVRVAHHTKLVDIGLAHPYRNDRGCNHQLPQIVGALPPFPGVDALALRCFDLDKPRAVVIWRTVKNDVPSSPSLPLWCRNDRGCEMESVGAKLWANAVAARASLPLWCMNDRGCEMESVGAKLWANAVAGRASLPLWRRNDRGCVEGLHG